MITREGMEAWIRRRRKAGNAEEKELCLKCVE